MPEDSAHAYRRIVLAARPNGAPKLEDFRLETAYWRPLAEGEFRLRMTHLSADPGVRARMGDKASYSAPFELGDVIDGFGVGVVEESRNDAFPLGVKVACASGWCTHFLSNGRGFVQKIPDLGIEDSAWIGVLGVPGLTAYFGLKRVGRLQEGERVLVTSAAGAVGALAGQLAKSWGAAQIVGVAGGAKKCGWAAANAGFDLCLDHRENALGERLKSAFPDGIDVMFDNVGAAMINLALPLMRSNGRIVISGQAADYSDPNPPGIAHTHLFIARRLRMEGFVVFDDARDFAQAQAEIASGIASGALHFRETRYDGFERLPEAFVGLFSGPAFGRRIVVL